MGDLTKNLSRGEFACKCDCGFDTVDVELLPALQHCADYFSKRHKREIWIEITGPNRCYEHNVDVGGAKNSMHVFARAVDVKFYLVEHDRYQKRIKGNQLSPKETYDFFDDNYYHFGIGLYVNRIHVDSRSTGAARWEVS